MKPSTLVFYPVTWNTQAVQWDAQTATWDSYGITAAGDSYFPDSFDKRRQHFDYIQVSPKWLHAAAIPFRQLDWPNPSPRRPPVQDWLWNWQARPTLPFSQADWPIPGFRRDQRDGYTLGPVGAPQDLRKSPYRNYDWPNPINRRPLLQDWVQGTNWILNDPCIWDTQAVIWDTQAVAWDSFCTQVPPGLQYDWPNPINRRALQQDWLWNWRSLTIQPPIGSQYDWINPVRRVAIQDTNLPAAIRSIGKPFVQYDWFVPVRRREVQDTNLPYAIRQIVSVPLPIGTMEFPNWLQKRMYLQDWVFRWPYYVLPPVPPVVKRAWTEDTPVTGNWSEQPWLGTTGWKT